MRSWKNSNSEIRISKFYSADSGVSVVEKTSENRFSLFGWGSAALGKCKFVKLTFVL
jgi:hypothetical protein